MNRLRFIFISVVVLLTSGRAAAYDFESGGLYYNILDADAKTVEVTLDGEKNGWDTQSSYTGSVVIPATVRNNGVTYSVTKVGEYAFCRSSITSLTIQNGLEVIADYAFLYCSQLQEVSLPSSLSSIGYSAFFDCYNLMDLIVPEGVSKIGGQAFCYCSRIKTLELPSTLTEIGGRAFGSTGGLTIVKSHIATPFAIEKGAFCSSESWDDNVYTPTPSGATLYIPTGTKAAYLALDGWTTFTGGIYEGEPQEITLSDGLIYSYITSERIATVIGYDNSDLEDLIIRSSVVINGETYNVKGVGSGAFRNYGMLKSLTIEHGVETIGSNAFSSCYNMNSVNLPSSLSTIGQSAFSDCNQLTSITIPEGVKTIDSSAFGWCSRLRILELPSTLTNIGGGAFRGLRSLSAVISHINTPFNISSNVFVIDENWNSQTQKYDYTPSSATLYVPIGSTSSYKAIEGWTMFADIVEGDYNEIEIDNITYSYSESTLTAVVIGSNFSDYNQNVTIKNSVTINGVDYEVKSIGAGAFIDNGRISSLIVSSGIETIAQSAFQSCWNLKSVQLPSSLTTIGNSAFQSCNNLRKIEIPSSIDSLGNYAFANCGNLLYVTSHIQTPFNINGSVFCSSSYWSGGTQVFEKNSATLYVPEGTKSAYEAIDGWNMFAEIVEGEMTEETIDGIIYSYNSSTQTATVVGSDFSEHRKVTIPSSVPINDVNYAVKTIGGGAFYNNYYIDSLYIESGIETIEKGAFQECYNIRYLELPSTLNTIGENAFRNCDGLRKVVLPSSLTSLGEYAFASCYGLSSVVSRIQQPLEIGQNVFNRGWNWDENNNQIFVKTNATLYVPIGTKSAYEAIEGWNMFVDILEGEVKETTYGVLNYSYVEGKGEATVISGDYSSLTNLTIPGSIEVDGVSYIVKAIDNYVFSNCNYLDSLVIESGVETIGQNAFYWCNNLKSVSLPTTLRSIGENAFNHCYYLSSLVIPEGVKTIGQNAFYWCYGIKKLELSSTIDSIGNYAFYGFSNLSKVICRIKTPFKISESVFCTNYYWENEVQVFSNSPATLYVPVGTKSTYETFAGWNMFDGGIFEGDPKEGISGMFNYIYMTDSKKAILVAGDYSNLRTLEIPATAVIDGESYNVVGIGNEAFQNISLTSVIIPEGVETIGKRAFWECYSLRSVKLPETITSIGDEAFQSCSVLDTISVPSNIKSIGTSAYWGTKITEVRIPASTTYIGRGAFAYCERLQSISVNANNSAYDSRNNCNALIDKATNTLMRGCPGTVIPNNVQVIGQHAFAGCLNLMEISIPNSVTTLENNSFSDCRALTSVVIPSSVTEIMQNVFSGCSSLKSIRVDENNHTYDSRNNCNAIIETATNTLMLGCQSTVIPRGITSIANNSFYYCEKLDSIKIPYGVTTIGNNAFYHCQDLQYVEIPNSVKNIYWGAFNECYNLLTIVSKIKAPESMTNMDWAFSGSYSSGTLYVPKGTKESYQNKYGWSDFYYIVEMDGDPLAQPTLSYDGRAITATAPEADVDMYYSTDNFTTSSYYDGPIPVTDLGTVKVIAEKTFRTDSEPAEYTIEYLYNGDTLKLAKEGLMAEAIKWCSTDSIEKMTVVGPINSTEFETIRTLNKLKFLNLAGVTNESLDIPDNAFANTGIVSFVAPAKVASVGSAIFSGCQQLAAVNWDTDKALPSDALANINNPNLLLYLKEGTTDIPAGINNVIVGGTTKKITLVDATGNNNFYCPVEFTTDTITYTRNFQQKTETGVSCGWETIVLPFNVQSIKHEKNGTLTPFVNTYSGDNRKPFWLYTLEQDNISAAYSIEANVPYLICMPNDDAYGDDYIQAGNVTFSAADKTNKIKIAVSNPVEKSQYDVTFVPTYQSVPASSEVFALNVNQEYKGYPAGSLFVNNFREVRPFEAYSVHPSAAAKVSASRMFTVGSLIGGDEDTTGIIDVMLKKNNGTNSDAVVRVYSLSGALVKQGKAEDVTKGLPKGIYIANGKKFVVR